MGTEVVVRHQPSTINHQPSAQVHDQEIDVLLLDGMPVPHVRALLLVDEAAGRAYRSNYNGDHPDAAGWPVYWRSLDRLAAQGLIVRAGRFHWLTVAGEELVAEAKRRHWRLPA